MTAQSALARQIDIVAVGRIKDSHWLAAQEVYLQRLTHYTKPKLTEVKDCVGRLADESAAVQREGEALLSAVPDGAFSILLTPIGKQFTSEGFAEWLGVASQKNGRLCFLIGGPLGVSPEVGRRADSSLALGSMTLPHELARIVLLEQLYRAATLLRGEAYHK